ncbi:MAG: leucyl aminopeptidase family protein [Paracoccaceae bacterium]
MSDDPITFAAGPDARPLHLVTPEGWPDLDLSPAQRAWAQAHGFAGQPGRLLTLPDAQGAVAGALLGLGDAAARRRTRLAAASAAAGLPEGPWRIATPMEAAEASEAALAWLLAAIRFDRYAPNPAPTARLVPPEGVDAPRILAMARAEALTRRLIDTPACDMGPDELEAEARALADAHGATVAVTTGDALLDANLPLIHAVGRASPRAPRLIDLAWGPADAPSLTVVGKGIVFDTGGLNLKPGASMGLMKKDMGGAATALGLASMLMATDAPVRLRVLLPVAENAVSGAAFHPGDILTARDGTTVEVNNTDAEGRLVLADALALAKEGAPDLTVSYATLTGAARVALGPDLPALFATHDADAAALMAGGAATADPLWRLPFHDPYEPMIEPGIAQLDNAPKGGMAGAITAALFLRRFAPDRYVHLDVYGWQPSAAPGRPKGGVGQGARALMAALTELLP